MATYGGGVRTSQAVVISQVVFRDSSSGVYTHTAYTAPANGYAIINLVNWNVEAKGASGAYVGTAALYIATVNYSYQSTSSSTAISDSVSYVKTQNPTIYLGPGQTIQFYFNVAFSSWGRVTFNATGVEFVNS